MDRVNDEAAGVIRLPRRKRRWAPFAGGHWRRGTTRETRVVDLGRYRQRRRLQLPRTDVACTHGRRA